MLVTLVSQPAAAQESAPRFLDGLASLLPGRRSAAVFLAILLHCEGDNLRPPVAVTIKPPRPAVLAKASGYEVLSHAWAHHVVLVSELLTEQFDCAGAAKVSHRSVSPPDTDTS